MNYNSILFRTPADAAESHRRAAQDFRLAARLEALGGQPYRTLAAETLVDLASEGQLIEPRGRPLVHNKIFGSQFIVQVSELRRDLVAYEQAHGAPNVAAITIRPSRDPNSKTGRLLDGNGDVPVANLRELHLTACDAVQRALEELRRRELISPLVVGRHFDPLRGGAAFDWHAHVTVELSGGHAAEVADYLRQKFGSDRIWISNEKHPEETRSLVATACYPATRLANRSYDDIADEYLLEFFSQVAGLRTIDMAGSLRVARRTRRASAASQDFARDDSTDARAAPSEIANGPRNERNVNAAAGEPTGQADQNEAAEPRLLRIHQAYLGLSLRVVARVANYRGWADLISRYNLDRDIAEAKALAERAQHILFLNPVNPAYPLLLHEPTSSKAAGGDAVTPGADGMTDTRDGAGDVSRPLTPEKTDDVVNAGNGHAYSEQNDRRDYGGVRDRLSNDLDASSHAGTSAKGDHDFLHGLTVELTVQSQQGPATATLRLRMPSGSHSLGQAVATHR